MNDNSNHDKFLFTSHLNFPLYCLISSSQFCDYGTLLLSLAPSFLALEDLWEMVEDWEANDLDQREEDS